MFTFILEKDYRALYNENVFGIRKRVSQYETKNGIISIIKIILKLRRKKIAVRYANS